MTYIRNIYYNLLAIQNNIILNFFLIGNIIYPSYFNDKVIHYKNLGDTYYKYIFFLNLGDKIHKKYNIDIINIGLKLYDKYKNISNNNDNSDDELEDILSNISEISDINDICNNNEFDNNDLDDNISIISDMSI